MWRRLKSIIAVHFSFVPSFLGRFLVFVLSSFSLFSWYLFFRPSPSPFACPSPRLFCSPSSSFLLVLVPVFSLSSRILLPFFFCAFASSFTPFSCFFFVFFFFSELSENFDSHGGDVKAKPSRGSGLLRSVGLISRCGCVCCARTKLENACVEKQSRNCRNYLFCWTGLMDVDSISPDGLRRLTISFRNSVPATRFHLPCTTRFRARDGGPIGLGSQA